MKYIEIIKGITELFFNSYLVTQNRVFLALLKVTI